MDGDAALIAATAVKPACLWCDTEFEPRKGGSPQRFCNLKCAMNFTRLVVGTPSAPSSADCSPSPICAMALRKHARFVQARKADRTTPRHRVRGNRAQ